MHGGDRFILPAHQEGWLAWRPWQHLRNRVSPDIGLTEALKLYLARRENLQLESWSSPSTAIKDLGVVGILQCDATREAFLQACREKYCEECALFILEITQMKEQGIFSGRVRPQYGEMWLDTIYVAFIQNGAKYELPSSLTACSHSCQVPNEMFGAEWQVHIVLACGANLIRVLFIWRSKRIHSNMEVSHVAEMRKAVPLTAPLIVAYLAIIVLVDVGVIETKLWYTVASVIQCGLQTVGIFKL